MILPLPYSLFWLRMELTLRLVAYIFSVINLFDARYLNYKRSRSR